MLSKYCILLVCATVGLYVLNSSCFADQIPKTPHQTGRVFIQGDFLLWKAEEDNLEYAIKITEPRSPQNIGKGRFKGNDPHHWSTGFKAAVGYLSCFDRWNLIAQWTHFHPERSKSHVSTPNAQTQPIYALWANGESRINGPIVPGALSASSRWDLAYDVADLKLNREFLIANYLSISPTIGVQSAWIDQFLYVKYHNFATNSINLAYRMKNNFWGTGLQAGVGTRWWLSRHLNIYGNGFGSLLWGHFKVSQRGSGNYVGIPNTSPLTRLKNSYHTIQGSIDLAIGVEWGFTVYHNRIKILLNGGWEQVIWFNQNQFITGLSTTTVDANIVHGDLGLSGIVAGLQIKW